MSNIIKTKDGRPMMLKKNHTKIKPTGVQKYKLNNQLTKKRRADYSDMYWLLDTSSSMAGMKLDQLKDTVDYLLPKYPLVHMIQFHDYASRITEERVPHLYARGMTAMFEALKMAYACNPSEIVIVSDGDPNDAPKGRIIELVEAEGVPVSCIGIGEDYDKEFLDTLASVSGGTSTDIATEDLHLLTEAFDDAVLKLTDQHGKPASGGGTINL